ncbi:condensation domain-containing protein [Streptomyces sp. NPDC050161]|uniref:condensation domain-containing protein n=1 Tax=Streptomyces sp. NPDC050161 TaxID=3365604 RepID=UPI00379E087D
MTRGNTAPTSARRQELARHLNGAATRDAPLVLPLSGAQRGLWLREQLIAGTLAYTETVAIDIEGPLDTAALRTAINTVVRSQDSLRTAFVVGRSGPVQVVRPPSAVEVPLEEVPYPESQDGPDDLLDTVVRDGLLVPFDLGRAPLLRTRLYRASETRATLALVVHHLVWDGGSMAVLLNGLADAYAAAGGRTRAPQAAGEPAPSYADVVRTVRAREADAQHRAAADRWADRFADVPAGALARSVPADDLTPDRGGRRSGVIHREITPPVWQRLRAEAAAAGCTTFMMGIACLTAALRSGPAPRPVLVSAPMSVRPQEAAGQIGYFTNTAPLVVTPPEGASRRAFLEEVRRSCVESWTHRHVPLEHLVTAARTRHTGTSPFESVLFNSFSSTAPVQDGTGRTWTARWLPSRGPRCDLMVSWDETDERILARFEYDADLITADDAGRIADAVLSAAEHLASGTEVHYDELPRCATRATASRPARDVPPPAEPTAVEVPARIRQAAEHVWREILGIEETDPLDDLDDFFALGGRSLEAVRIATRLSSSLERRVPPRMVAEAESFGEFLTLVAATEREKAE